MTNGISRKGSILTVDLSQWETQQDFAETLPEPYNWMHKFHNY